MRGLLRSILRPATYGTHKLPSPKSISHDKFKVQGLGYINMPMVARHVQGMLLDIRR